MVLWVPLTSHCYLEDSGLFEAPADQCCSTDASKSSPADPCDTGCKLVEKSAGKIQDDQRLVVPVISLLVSVDFTPTDATLLPVDEVTFWPPETLRLTQFIIRTSLPVRAPSLLS